MKRDFLSGIGLTKEQTDMIMAEYGKSVEGLRSALCDSDMSLKTAISEKDGKDAQINNLISSYESRLSELSASYDEKLRELTAAFDEKSALLSEKDAVISERNTAIAEKDTALSQNAMRISELGESEGMLCGQVKELEERVGSLLTLLTKQALSGYCFSSPSAKEFIFERVFKLASSGEDICGIVEKIANEEPEAFALHQESLPIFSSPVPSCSEVDSVNAYFTRRHA